MSFTVISCSLNPGSRSRILALRAANLLAEQGVEADYVDLRDFSLPTCDASSCYGNPNVQELRRRISAAEGLLLATPIYNFSASASVVNLIELTGDAWNEKVVGFLCAAGGKSSYMAVMGLANSLMLDFRAVVLPRFVFTDDSHFSGDDINSEEIHRRMNELTKTLIRFGHALKRDA